MPEAEPVEKSEEQVKGEPEEPDDEDAGEDVVNADKALRTHHHGADTVRGGDDLGDDEVGPAHREHLAGRVEIAGQGRGKNDAGENTAACRPEGARAFHELFANRFGVVHEEGHEKPDHPENEQRDLLPVSRPEPHEEKRDEGRRGEIAEGRDERVEETLHSGEGAHQYAERKSNRDGNGETDDDALNALDYIEAKTALGEEPPERFDDGDRTGEEGLGGEVGGGKEMPSAKKKDPSRDPEKSGEAAVDRFFELEEQHDPFSPLCDRSGRREFGIACRDSAHRVEQIAVRDEARLRWGVASVVPAGKSICISKYFLRSDDARVMCLGPRSSYQFDQIVTPMSRPRNRSQQVAWRIFLNAHALVTKRVDAALLEAGCISYETYDVLITLSEAAGHRLRMSELADATFFSNSGISRRVGRLEKEGYLRREGCESDGRVFYAILTEAGKGALRLAWPVYEQVIEDDFAKAMSAVEARELSRILKSVVTKIDGTLAGEMTEEPRC